MSFNALLRFSFNPVFALFRSPLLIAALLYCKHYLARFSINYLSSLRQKRCGVIELKWGVFLSVLLDFFIRCQNLFIGCFTLKRVFVVEQVKLLMFSLTVKVFVVHIPRQFSFLIGFFYKNSPESKYFYFLKHCSICVTFINCRSYEKEN